jgi:hypothetical protein
MGGGSGGGKINIPSSYTIALNPVNLGGSMTLTLDGSSTQPLVIDAGLDDMGLSLTGNPKEPISVGVSLTGNPKEPIAVDMGLDHICMSIALTQIPRVKVHLPTRYDLGLCLFGVPIFSLRFAGETMLVTEDNPPRVFYKPPAPRPHHTAHGARAEHHSGLDSAAEVRVNLTPDDK